MVRGRILIFALASCVVLGLGTGLGVYAGGQRGAAQVVVASVDPQTTPRGWNLTPAGSLITVDKTDKGFQGPLGLAMSPDGASVLATGSGASQYNSVDQFSLRQLSRTSFVTYDGTQGQAVFYGVVYSPDGRWAYASGGGQNVIHKLQVTPGGLSHVKDIPAGFFAAGIAYGHTPNGDRIYVANNMSTPQAGPGPYDNLPGHTVTVIDPSTDLPTKTIDLGTPLEPLGVTFDRTGTKAYVTEWMGRAVSVIDTRTEQKIGDISLSPQNDPLQADHPSAITFNPVRNEVYSANANSDTVSVIDTQTDRLVATIPVGFQRGGPKGATPDGLSVSPDGSTLYVTNAGDNDVAVVSLLRRQTLGFIPTGWYPTDVRVTPDGKSLVILSQKGFGAGPNPCGSYSPLPACASVFWETQYVGTMMKGMIQVVSLPLSDSQLQRWTAQVMANDRVAGGNQGGQQGIVAAAGSGQGNDQCGGGNGNGQGNGNTSKPGGSGDQCSGVPGWLQGKIKHVIYVIKENRTYDQVLGDLGKGNGDPSLTIFKDDSAPNHRQLARQFVLLDSFFTDSDVSADGHPWATQANANDYVEKTWPVDYAPWPRSAQRNYDEEYVPPTDQFSTEPLASDPRIPRSPAAQTVGYIWDNAYTHGVSFRDYGEATRWADPANCHDVNFSDLTRLSPSFGNYVDPSFPGWNLSCSDHNNRLTEWNREFQSFVKNGNLPALQIVYFPNDHNAGTSPGAPTPASYMADNDVALGKLVDAVSHSPYWRDTAIFVTEDDAQDGPDHVDAHRAPAFVISPYTQRGAVVSTTFDQAGMVGTIEALLGLPPMNTFDQRAPHMWSAFTNHPNFAPYDARTPSVIPFDDSGYPVNSASAPLAKQSAAQNFGRPDGASQYLLNVATWKSIKGARSTMPAPICHHGCSG